MNNRPKDAEIHIDGSWYKRARAKVWRYLNIAGWCLSARSLEDVEKQIRNKEARSLS